MFRISWTEISIIAALCIIFCINFKSLLTLLRNPKFLCEKIGRNFLSVFTGDMNDSKKQKSKKQSDKILSIDEDNQKQ
ncbi:hypothetical protein [Candidatus Liberibacter americanus]|uniref:Uncharacterized protein n=1 Tax=Candidatus Liberibacter americanus str. Sao Paulo TaxID=1261131 RepID=U6B523_9HYPH|nr:hypothetical protein [Candidatus Liberibacter americanus]AHA27683.1 hypothetical protein lam_313 [Candidatus Liberibacter americanus str. Sao Paulo]EMS36391.1 hypothetical protein G653_01908 [Candidatus Liberibacter americanus PW_SP]